MVNNGYVNYGCPANIHNLRIAMSPLATTLCSNQFINSLEGYTSLLCVDGGTNISLMGRVFKILSWTDQLVDMNGFANGFELKNVKIGSGVAVYESGNESVLIGLHKAPCLQSNAVSLLSTG